MSARGDSSSELRPSGSEGTHSGFNTTHWSVVLMASHEEGSPAAAAALERLCRTYWYPLYAYARRQGQSPPDAQDSTQQFFAVFLEKNYFNLADPQRGRFRCFLLASFKHFLANEHHRRHAAKRGGGCKFVSWDEVDAEALYRNELAGDPSPDKLFEHAWALTLLEKVMKDLHQEYVREGKGGPFEALQGFLTGEKAEATYAQIGETLEMSESAVKMAVLRLRRRYREMLRSEISHTVMEPGIVDEELRHLIGVLAR